MNFEIIKSVPHSPYFIFIKGIEKKSDEDILNLFDLDQIEQVSNNLEGDDKHCIYLFRDREWVHLMDNFYYDLWYSTNFKTRLNVLGKQFEIFSCRLKDVDESYDFNYFKDGKLIREFVSESPNYSDTVVKVDYGNKISGELKDTGIKNDVDYPLIVAKSLGVNLVKSREDISCYKVKMNTE